VWAFIFVARRKVREADRNALLGEDNLTLLPITALLFTNHSLEFRNRDNELPPESVDLAHVICSDWASLAK
jgi:hypothetical protein